MKGKNILKTSEQFQIRDQIDSNTDLFSNYHEGLKIT